MMPVANSESGFVPHVPNQHEPHSARLDAQFYSLVKMSDSTLLSNKLEQLCDLGFNVHKIYGGHTTAIYVASEYGKEELVRLLLERYGAENDILTPDRVDHDTAIHAATIGGNSAVLRLLEGSINSLSGRRGVHICIDDVFNKYFHTPLHHALGRGRVEMARHWINRGANLVSGDWTGATPLHFAARNGEIGGLELLKEYHQRRQAAMDVNQQSSAGLTALHYAAWNGKDRAVEWLLLEGSDLEAVDHVEKNTALHWAAMRGHRETVRELVIAHVRQGVELFKENSDKKTVLELLEKYSPIEELHALLQLVEEQGLLDMKAFPPMVLVKYVMGHGSLNAVRKLERSLEYAAVNCNSKEYQTNLKTLLEDKLMIWLAKKGNTDSVSLLMTVGTYLPGGFEFLPQTAAAALHQAFLHKKFEFADALAKQEASRERLSEWIRTMKIRLTSSAGSLIDKLDSKDKAALASPNLEKELAREIPLAFWVFQDGRNDVVAKFLKDQDAWGPFINEQGPKTHRTALHWAYKFDKQDIVTKLLEVRGCDPDIKDKERKSPIRYAVERRGEERQVFVDALNAIIVGAALVASISFGGLVQPPLGYTPDPTRGPARARVRGSGNVHVDLSSTWMKAFWFSNSSSFFLAMASALTALRGVLPMPDIPLDKVVYKIQKALLVASSLLVGSIVSALIAFGAAGMAVVRTTVRAYMIVPTTIGLPFCILILLWFIWGIRLLCLPRKVEEVANGPPDVLEPEQDVAVDNVKEPKYKTGPRYSEYPWEDGLDELYKKLDHVPRATQRL